MKTESNHPPTNPPKKKTHDVWYKRLLPGESCTTRQGETIINDGDVVARLRIVRAIEH